MGMYTLKNKDDIRTHLIAYAEKWIGSLNPSVFVTLTSGVGSAGHTFYDIEPGEFVAECSRLFDVAVEHDFSPGPFVARVQRGKYDIDLAIPVFTWGDCLEDFRVDNTMPYDGPFPVAVRAAYPLIGTPASCA